MSSHAHADEHPMFGRVTLRAYSVWLLCALLVLFCISAKRGNYDTSRHSLRIAAQQAFISADKARRDHPRATLLQLFYPAAVSIPLFLTARKSLRRGTIRAAYPGCGFDAERHLRPPPHA